MVAATGPGGQDGDFTPFSLVCIGGVLLLLPWIKEGARLCFSTGKTTSEPTRELSPSLSGKSGRNQRQLVGANGKRRRKNTEAKCETKEKVKVVANERTYERQTKREMAGANGTSMTGPGRALGR